MRRVVVGVGDDGRSTVLSSGPPPHVYRFGGAAGNSDPHALTGRRSTGTLDPAAAGEVVVGDLWATVGGVAPDGRDPTTVTDGFDVECPPGGTRWRIVEMGPRRTAPLHRTVTVDYDLVLDGEIELVLEDGPVRLAAGDSVVLPGVTHGWQTGEVACTMAVVQVALPST